MVGAAAIESICQVQSSSMGPLISRRLEEGGGRGGGRGETGLRIGGGTKVVRQGEPGGSAGQGGGGDGLFDRGGVSHSDGGAYLGTHLFIRLVHPKLTGRSSRVGGETLHVNCMIGCEQRRRRTSATPTCH